MDVKLAYPNFDYCISNYNPMLEQFGEIIIQVDDNDYQGDSRLLYKKEDMYGYLQFGWGSCSGCDALQGCETYEDLQRLSDSLETSIQWKTLQEMKDFFDKHDWEGDYSWHESEQKLFIQKCKDYLNEISKQ